MSKESHPYFIPNDPDRRTTAVLLTGTATEYGIDQHSIQMVQGGFNVTKEMAEAVYGKGFDDPDVDDEGVKGDEADGTHAEQVPEPGEPVVTGSPKDGSATTAQPVEDSEVSDAEPEADQSVAPEHQDPEPDYDAWEYNDLKAEIARRQIETSDRRADTYVAALKASDADQAEEDTE